MKKSIIRTISVFMALLMLFCVVPMMGTLAVGGDFEYVYLGSYPQSEVKDSATLAELNKLSLDWKSYGYYSGDGNYGSMKQGDWMKYADVSYNGEKYRAVYFSQYRPGYTFYPSSIDNSLQDDNGYRTNVKYWFKYEPLKWRILDKENGIVVSEYLIDSQAFSDTVYKVDTENDYSRDYCYSNSDMTIYANNYYDSTIRLWLNVDFYNTAFSNSDKLKIKTDFVDNSMTKTGIADYDNSKYVSINSKDNVFLLSTSELEKYFYTDDWMGIYNAEASGSDYAMCQGLEYVERIINDTEENNSNQIELLDNIKASPWRLRTPMYISELAEIVRDDGIISLNSPRLVENTNIGIRPAIRLNSLDNSSGEPESKPCSHICHKSGISAFFYKIVRFFWKLFKMNKFCSCGAAHY